MMMSDFETSKNASAQQQLATSLFKRTGGPFNGFRAESWADAVEANRVLSHITNS
jgi:hypothetical protein